jgi:hypothetical protein
MDHHAPIPDEPADDGEAPFGLPILAELPDLARVLGQLTAVDRMLADAIGTLMRLLDTGEVERVAGVDVDHFVMLVARRTGADRRMLTTAVRTCQRLPSLWHALAAGRLSWAQTRSLVLRLQQPVPVDDATLDGIVAGAINDTTDAEPDAAASRLGWALDALRTEPTAGAVAADDDGFLHLQPRLDGSGGRVFGDLGPVPFAMLDTATAPGPDATVAPTRDGFASDATPERAGQAARTLGRRRLASLTRLLWAHHHTDPRADRDDRRMTSGATRDDVDVVDGPRSTVGGGSGVGLLVRAELDTLLGHDSRSAQLLTTLAGGVMHVTPVTARRLADAGIACRLIVTDAGHVVGVGRRTRKPPGWLREALLAVHDTCTAPGCRRAALTSQLDHATPWIDGGTTDATNCGPVCTSDNRVKERAGWRATGHPDGRRRWHHPRSGLTTTTMPATGPPRSQEASGPSQSSRPPPDPTRDP